MDTQESSQNTSNHVEFSQDQAFEHEVSYVYSQSMPVFLGNLFNTLLIYLLFQEHTNEYIALGWLALSLFSAGTRFISSKIYNDTNRNHESASTWYRRYYLSTMISAIIWGSAGVIFFAPNNDTHQILLAFVISSMSAGAVSILPVFLGLYYRYLALVIVPIDFMLLTRGGETGFLTGLLLIIFALIMFQAAKTMNRLVTRAIELRFKLEQLATIDALTGLYNRRFFNETLNREWERGRRDQTRLAMIMIDVDHFKDCNDNYGHLHGDDVLKQVAEIIQNNVLRGVDLVCRYGGEEFVVLLPETNIESAQQIAEKLRQSVADKNIPHAFSPVAKHLTISAGVSEITPNEQCNAVDLINAADRALYQAKTNGRNQVHLAAAC